MSDRDFDEKLRRTFDYVTENVEVSDDMFNNIKSKSNGGKNMKFKLKKSYAVIAAVVLSLTAATGIIAASRGGVTWVGGSSHLTEKSGFPDESEVKDVLGYTFKYVEDFDNGFKFSKYNFGDVRGMDEDGNVINEGKEAHFDYVKDKGTENERQVYFNARQIPDYLYQHGDSQKSINYKGVDIRFNEYVYKVFPPNFEDKEVSKEDEAKAKKLMEEAGPDAQDITKVYPYLSGEEIRLYKENKLMISYGSSEIETKINKDVSWYEDGVSYVMLTLGDEEIQADDFFEMAKQVIDAE